MAYRVFLDSFTGAVADLKPKQRTIENVLIVLDDSPLVSTWDMSSNRWLQQMVAVLVQRKFIEEDKKERYPWHRYKVTDLGKAYLADANKIGGDQ